MERSSMDNHQTAIWFWFWNISPKKSIKIICILIITLCQLLKVVVTESLENTGRSLGDGDGLALPRGDPRRRDRGGAAVFRRTTEDLTEKDPWGDSFGTHPHLQHLHEQHGNAPFCAPQSESRRQYFGIWCPTWPPRSPPGLSTAWGRRLRPCWRESSGCPHCDYTHCGQTPSWAADRFPWKSQPIIGALTWPSAWWASPASPGSSLVTCRLARGFHSAENPDCPTLRHINIRVPVKI